MVSLRVYPAGSDQVVANQLAAARAELALPRFHARGEPGISFPVNGARFGEPGWPYTDQPTVPFKHADGRLALEIDARLAAIDGRVRRIVVDGVPTDVTIRTTPTDSDFPGGRDAWTVTAAAAQPVADDARATERVR